MWIRIHGESQGLFASGRKVGNYIDTPLANCVINPEGIEQDDKGRTLLQLCKTCYYSLCNGKTPPLSLANGTYLGPVPSELSDLTPIEEAMIARCRAK